MVARDELHRIVDELPETELDAARSLLEELRNGEDSLSAEELAEIDHGREAIRRGDYVTLEQYKKQRGL
jgi:hypothetical protein